MTSPWSPVDEDGERVVDDAVLAQLQAGLSDIAQQALTAVTDEVQEYGSTLTHEMAATIEGAIVMALGTFLRLVDPTPGSTGRGSALDAARAGAYELGRGEAKVGRTVDALLAAYRVGARASWREVSSTAVAGGTPAQAVARFAELVFAYIDELSAASVAGHADELAASGRLRQERREQLARALLMPTATGDLIELAEEAGWSPPHTLTVVLLPSARVHDTLPQLDPSTLYVPADAVDLASDEPMTVLLVSDAVRTRPYLLRVLAGRSAVVGPPRPWTRVAGSLGIAARAQQLTGRGEGAVVDTHDHLADLVVTADAEALADLRAAVLEPLDELTPAARERLTDTLRAWLLHLGRRGDVAASLHVHPQTVRYRMNQVRDLYGDRLDDPATVESLVVALAAASSATDPPG